MTLESPISITEVLYTGVHRHTCFIQCWGRARQALYQLGYVPAASPLFTFFLSFYTMCGCAPVTAGAHGG